MRTVYEAANAVEAHMIVDLLRQDGIEAHVRGESLTGAMGELPAGGLVRVEVDEVEHVRARAIVERWDAAQPAATASAPAAQQLVPGRTLLAFGAGLVAGVLCAAFWFKAPVSKDGLDYNDDGTLDEIWTFAPNGYQLKTQVDRNLDGKIDLRQSHGRVGMATDAEADDDFDGTFETRMTFRRNSVERVEVDTDRDGIVDLRTNYRHGVTVSNEYIDPYTAKPRKVEYLKLGKPTHADIDTNGDGVLDKRVRYDEVGEVAASESIR